MGKKNGLLRVAAFGFRSLPPKEGSAGSEKIAIEFYPRLVKRGINVVAYNRIYGNEKLLSEYKGVKLINLKTVSKSGFDTFIHSMKATFHIIVNNTADIIHIHNGGNSIWAIFLQLFGKKVMVSQDGIDWERAKWSWYAKLFLKMSIYITAHIPNKVVFDNIYVKEIFEKRFKRNFDFIPYGSEVENSQTKSEILEKLNLISNDYFLFVGRFIPDKGIHYLIEAFEKIKTNKKLVLVGGSPNPSEYEKTIRDTLDNRIIFPGYIYGGDTVELMKNAFCYVQPSDVEGLSPVILTIMNLGTPLICSDIKENKYAVGDTCLQFTQSNTESLKEILLFALDHPDLIIELAKKAQQRAKNMFSWESFTEKHIELFRNFKKQNNNTAESKLKIIPPFQFIDKSLADKYLTENKFILHFSYKHKLYYNFIRPMVSVKIRRFIQKYYSWKIHYKPNFINDEFVGISRQYSNMESSVNNLYPDHYTSAVIITHDVEAQEGFNYIPKMLELLNNLGLKTSWNIVPYKYKIDEGIIRLIKETGHEIGIHGYNHDGKLYYSEKEFNYRAKYINEAIEKYEAVGFRSPMAHRNLQWLQRLNIEYDASCFDYDPFQPFPGGTASIWPFMAGKFVELPYTLPQDHTLFYYIKAKDINIWKSKIDWLVKNNGMILTLNHPDYLLNKNHFALYKELLIYIKEIKNSWHCLPREISQWWIEPKVNKG